MKFYLVGGAVRDELLGCPVQDRDWVVVGAQPQQLIAQGYAPVGKDFPVFLHPETHEEYALARTERKVAAGYHGFAFDIQPHVTLEQDLQRRDLTINAIAQTEQGELIDPFRGREDLANKVLRHVSPAFAEDPVRILRVARFAARFHDFTIAPETLTLMQNMVAQGEVDALVPERVWQELARGLMADHPSRMFYVLRDCGALARLLPEVDRLFGVPQTAQHHPEVDTGVHCMMVLDMSAQLQAPLTVRYACLGHDLGKGLTPADILPRHLGHESRSVKLLQALGERWRVPKNCQELGLVVAREHGHIHGSNSLGPEALLRLLERCDALRKPERFAEVLLACECDARGRLGFENQAYPQSQRLWQALQTVRAVSTAEIAEQAQQAGLSGVKVGEKIQRARVQALAEANL